MTDRAMPRSRSLPVLRVLAVPVIAVALVGCSRGTDRAVPGPTAPAPGTSGVSLVAADALTTDVPAAPVPPAGSATATAGLMAGFPTDVIPVPPGATVTASAVRTAGDRLEVSLSGTSSASVAAVLAFYDRAFRGQGFTPAVGSTLAPGTGGRVYARGDQMLLVAVDGAGPKRSFSVGGTVQR